MVGGEAPASDERSTSGRRAYGRLHLNAFRGEPAISVFDWHFTPTHSSSETFATVTGSALHVLLRTLQPGHGWLTRFQVYCERQARCSHSVSLGLRLKTALTGPLTVTRRVILQKARDHRAGRASLRLSLHGRGRFQALFHSPRRGAFHRSLTVLCAIGHT